MNHLFQNLQNQEANISQTTQNLSIFQNSNEENKKDSQENSQENNNLQQNIHHIIKANNLNDQDYNFDIQNGTITLNLENNGNVSSHLDIIQNIICYLYSEQLSSNNQSNIQSNNSGRFSVIPINNTNIPPMCFSFLHNQELDSNDSDEEDFDNELNDDKYDYFLNCKFINKYAGKAKKVKKDDILLKDECECFICFEKYKEKELTRTLQCGHTFHKKCVDKWLKKRSTCPHCRFDLMENVQLSIDDADEYMYEEHKKHKKNCPNISYQQGLIHIEFGYIQQNNNHQQNEEINNHQQNKNNNDQNENEQNKEEDK
jgi:hypothetical protein